MSTILARGEIDGPEARGSIRIVEADDARTVEVADLWVSPGAPDVRIFASAHADGTVDEMSTDLGPYLFDDGPHHWAFPNALTAEQARSIVIYCGEYSVCFGHAQLEWTP